MKKLYIFLFFLISQTIVYGQFGPEQLITAELENPSSLTLGDIDGDMLPDIIIGSVSTTDLINWGKNIDGHGIFDPFKIVGPGETLNISVSDLDGDNDLDVLTAFRFEDQFVWYENLDGQGNFSAKKIIDNAANGAYEIIAADMDGDNDNDLVATIDLEGDIVWYENLDGQGTFSTRKEIGFLINGSRSIVAADIDGDDDLDVVAGTGGDKTIVWYENLNGLGNFGAEMIIAGAASAVSDIFCIDLDNDDDIDIVGASGDNKISWYENLDGQGSYGTPTVIVEGVFCSKIHCTDLDNDNDNDLLFYNSPSVDIENSEVLWSENLDGQGNFGVEKVIGGLLINVRSVYSVDIDNDNDQDVFATCLGDDEVVWYENLTVLNVTDIKALGIKLYPNPAKEVLNIESLTVIEKVTIYNTLGSTLKEVTANFNEISLDSIPSGLLLVALETEKGKVIQKIVKE